MIFIGKEWDTLIWERKNGISWVTLNRPQIRNAVNYDMMKELDEVITEVEKTEDKLLVLTGNGERAFCSGGDLTLFHSLYTEEEAYPMLSNMGNILKRLFFFPKPTVAFLNGAAVGGGCELATACDIRIAKKGIKFGFVQGTLGITTGWGGGTLLYERLSPKVAYHYLLSSQLVPAEKGYADGFIQYLIEDEDAQTGWSDVLVPYLKQSADVLAAYKAMFLNRIDVAKLRANIEKEIRTCAKLWESEEHHEAVQHFLNK